MGFYYRHKCFTRKYATRKTDTQLHPGAELRIFHIPASGDIDDVISATVVLQSRFKNGGRAIFICDFCPYNNIPYLSHGGHLEKIYCFSPLSLALKSFKSRPRGAEQLILFSWD
jgi:hypothetical protein